VSSKKGEAVVVRKAVIGDVKSIHTLLNRYGDKGLLLQRSLSELYDHLRDYFIIEASGSKQQIAGVVGLHICWEDLAEIKALAIEESVQGRGLGARLVEACFEEARALGLKKVFALTYIPEFFERLGFQQVDKSVLPHKIWADCLKCPKFPDCDEVALMAPL
jgi:amino-acid N-acetyltransferase